VKVAVVNFYLERAEEKMPFYLALARCCSDSVTEVAWQDFGPNFAIEEFSAVMLTGSQWMLAGTEAPPALHEFVRSLNLPVLGICFGHQLLAQAFGGRVLAGAVVERHETILVGTGEPLFHGLGPEVEMLESHREFVDRASVENAGWLVDATSVSCPVEAMHHSERPLYGVQFHPERSGPNGEKLVRNFFDRVVQPWLRTGVR
jgi:GMP synthase (glutamine-hydrolysing)